MKRKSLIFIWKNSPATLTVKENSFISNPKFHFIIFLVLNFRFGVSYSAGKIIFKKTFFINPVFGVGTKIEKSFYFRILCFFIIFSMPSNLPNERNSLKTRRILYFLFSGFRIAYKMYYYALLTNCFANILKSFKLQNVPLQSHFFL